MKKMHHIICLFAHYRKFTPEIEPLWLKNRNQRFHKGGLLRTGGGYVKGAYTWDNRSVKERVGLSPGRTYTREAYRRRNTV